MDDDWPEFPVILGFGSTHEVRDAEEPQRCRLWGLKSTSKAACIAYDKPVKYRPSKVGFLARKPK